MEKLKVIYKGKCQAGILWRDEKGYHFEYEENFISDEKLLPISVNMPKEKKVFHSKTLFSNFQSILSEGYNRGLQCKSLGIDINDEWSLLSYTCGNDTIGAITIQKENE